MADTETTLARRVAQLETDHEAAISKRQAKPAREAFQSIRSLALQAEDEAQRAYSERDRAQGVLEVMAAGMKQHGYSAEKDGVATTFMSVLEDLKRMTRVRADDARTIERLRGELQQTTRELEDAIDHKEAFRESAKNALDSTREHRHDATSNALRLAHLVATMPESARPDPF